MPYFIAGGIPVDRSSNTITVIRERRMTIPRYACSIHARIALASGETHCTVIDVSTGGLGIRLDAVIRLKNGQPVIITAPQLGGLRGTVQWVMANRAGIAFTPNSNDLSHVKALIASFETQRIDRIE